MFPSQTSLIPVTVALSRFFIQKGFPAFFQNYPFWYLGSTPFRYLIGPIIPILLGTLSDLVPGISLFSLTIYLVLLSLVLGGAGWGLLIKKIIGKDAPQSPKTLYIVFFLLYFLTPWKYFSALTLDEATIVAAKSLIPFVLVAVWVYLSRKNIKSLVISSLGVAFLLLINTDVLLILIIGVVALCLTISFKNGKIRHFDKKLKRAWKPLVLGLLFATIWYGPGFWWIQLVNPGIGGAAGISVILKLIDFLKNLTPLAIAVLVLYFSRKIKDRLTIFSLTWLLAFAFLTLYRFLANPVFWTDWLSWMTEVEIGIVLLAFTMFSLKRMLHGAVIILFPFLAVIYVFNLLGQPKFLSTTVPSAILSLGLVKSVPHDQVIFITGSNTFWLNSFFDVSQVRGGRDAVSVDPNWLKAMYVFRESSNMEDINKKLNLLNVSYVLVNSSKSLDHYKDYKNVSIWHDVGTTQASENGDYLIKIK